MGKERVGFQWDAKRRCLSLESGRFFLGDLRPEITVNGRPRKIDGAKRVHVEGPRAVIEHDGILLSLELHGGNGFVELDTVVSNGTASDVRIASVAPLVSEGDWFSKGAVNVGRDTVLRTFPAERFYGYDLPMTVRGNMPRVSCWFVAWHDPASREGFMAGSGEAPAGFVRFRVVPLLSETAGRRVLRLRCDIDCLSGSEGVRVPAGASFRPGCLLLHEWEGEEAMGLHAFGERLAEAVRQGRRLPALPNGWCSWYGGFGADFNEEECLRNLQAAVRIQGLETFQIDDGWVEGIEARCGTVIVDRRKFPSGIAETARRIRHAGMRAGIWFRPFRGWGEGEDVPPWASGPCLDLSHPAVHEWLSETVGRLTREWGFSFIKLDYLAYDVYGAWGMELLEPRPARYVPVDDTRTNVQHYRDALSTIREAVGEGCLLTGCNCLLGPALGVVDAMRIGDDVDAANWDRIVTVAARAVEPMLFLHTRVWYNDADCLLVHPPLSEREAWAWSAFPAITGHAAMVGSPLHALTDARERMLRALLPVVPAEPSDLSIREREGVSLVVRSLQTPSEHYHVAGVFNWGERAVEVPFDDFFPQFAPSDLVCSFGNGRTASVSAWGTVRLEPRSCTLFRVTPRRPFPWVCGSDAHVLQGVFDFISVRWDDEANVLVITSAVERPATVFVSIPAGFSPQVSGALKVLGLRGTIRVPLREGAREHRLHFTRDQGSLGRVDIP
ncbi:MAG: alpha-galactosidase [Bacteroidota bacterium]|nr:alpha-galactosidase [Bacteroidota bacterium]